jgi:hypothetical protein
MVVLECNVKKEEKKRKKNKGEGITFSAVTAESSICAAAAASRSLFLASPALGDSCTRVTSQPSSRENSAL